MTESTGPVYDAAEKLNDAIRELESGMTRSDRDATVKIFSAMCAANLAHMDRADTLQHLALAAAQYTHRILRLQMVTQVHASSTDGRPLR